MGARFAAVLRALLGARADAAYAALVLVAGLALLARPAPRPPFVPCRHPHEWVGGPRGTLWVGCDPHRPGRPLRGAAPLLFGGRLDLQRAPGWALEALPGIGPARARAIVAFRATRPLEAVESLRAVRGIGPATLARLAGWVRVGGPGRTPDRRAEAGSVRPRRSQKPFQLLSIPCENSYKSRADAAGGGRSKALQARPADVSLCLDHGIQGLQGGSPSCD